MTTKLSSKSKVVIVTDNEVICDNDIDSDLLLNRRLYKTFSLLLASRNNVKILPTLLMLEPNYNVIKQAAEVWGWPLMMRMDYSVFPKQKPLGGIPLYNNIATKKVSQFLFAHDCFPLIHPHADRFKDEYSVGVLINPKSDVTQIEIVGKGFDAGDLRLGKSIPHELLSYSINNKKISQDFRISDDTYSQYANDRRDYACKLNHYIYYVNKQYRMLSNIDHIEYSNDISCNNSPPKSYKPLSPSLRNSLTKSVEVIYYYIINELPKSNHYVASFSYFPGQGWLLWDIYGHWYNR